MIGTVLRGTTAARLLYYLYSPGKTNEHTDPHLVAGFSDPADLEPERRPGGSRDFQRLAGPLAALAGPSYDNPVWHCAVRAAPGDRLLSDAEWAQVAAEIMDRTGLAPAGDELGVRWVAVRHAADHIHLVATLARQDGTRPRIWNDFYRVREACQDAESKFGLSSTAPADRTAGRRLSRAETEQAARRGWKEPPRVTLRRPERLPCVTAAWPSRGCSWPDSPSPGPGTAAAPASRTRPLTPPSGAEADSLTSLRYKALCGGEDERTYDRLGTASTGPACLTWAIARKCRGWMPSRAANGRRPAPGGRH